MESIKITKVEKTQHNKKHSHKLYDFFVKKISYYNQVISNVMVDIDIKIKGNYITENESLKCMDLCRSIYNKLTECNDDISQKRETIDDGDFLKFLQSNIKTLQDFNDTVNSIVKTYGCYNLEHLLMVCFGSEYNASLVSHLENSKHLLLCNYFHPTSFKCYNWKGDNNPVNNMSKNKMVDDQTIVETAKSLECFDLARTSRFFRQKIDGIKVVYQNTVTKKTLIITGYVDNPDIHCMNCEYIDTVKKVLMKSKSMDINVGDTAYGNYIRMLSLKEYLMYSTNELYKNFIGIMNQYELMKYKILTQVVSEFMNMELHLQLKFIKTLLIHHQEPNAYYLCGIVYSLLIEDDDGVVDNRNQIKVYSSLPFECRYLLKRIKMNYKESMISKRKKFNIKKLTYEQRIEMLCVDDDVKDKAYDKMKEISSKSQESGSKARGFLDGLLKIPFGDYKEEPILKCKGTLVNASHELITSFNSFITLTVDGNESIHDNITNFNILKTLHHSINGAVVDVFMTLLQRDCIELGRFQIKKKIDEYNLNVKSIKLKHKTTSSLTRELKRITTTGKKKNEMMCSLAETFKSNLSLVILYENHDVIQRLVSFLPISNEIFNSLWELLRELKKYEKELNNINILREASLGNIDDCVYGHTHAKKQIKNIINQWITGEKSGYCFGFEGPPGIGKTSMAKTGLANCLFDQEGIARPFDFIALGGSSNGSYLNGHNYTYLGSSWGRVVDILITKQCMNPIIFIDELDKVSNSEYGKEITGILTHLVDSTQNTAFQDKFFSGIDIDLSKALFIFSYNDPSKIDPILLDRIHRIKFDKLTPFDKVVISRKYLIPEVNKKFGMSDDFITISDDTILFLIDHYTYESGVRKLKQLYFEIWGDINEQLLANDKCETKYSLSQDALENIFLRERNKMIKTVIPSQPSIGIINGLWANAYGMGGVTPIQIKWFPCKTPLELKLTGMQGDVMKESMNVAKTIAWNKLSDEGQSTLWSSVSGDNQLCYGLHIHCPEGAVNKDGPSAGGAITTALISMFKQTKIDNQFAMTGEINLNGNITAIGGLEQKLYYGIGAGVKVFAFPKDNLKDYEMFREKYCDKIAGFDKIKFYSVGHIDDVCALM